MKLFVYGTLKKGFNLNHYLSGEDYLGAAEVQGFDLFDVGGSYPAMTKSQNAQSVVMGEVYEVADAQLIQVLDLVESAYKRMKILSKMQGGKPLVVSAYVYKYKNHNFKKITSGKWE